MSGPHEKSWDFQTEMGVRDYECDLQGIVNNAEYQHYLEHARHLFLRAIGIDFHAMHQEGTDPVVTRIEIDYRRPLTSGDRFVVRLRTRREGRLRFVFEQDIINASDGQTMVDAVVHAVFLRSKRPIPPPEEIVEAIDTFRLHRRSS